MPCRDEPADADGYLWEGRRGTGPLKCDPVSGVTKQVTTGLREDYFRRGRWTSRGESTLIILTILYFIHSFAKQNHL